MLLRSEPMFPGEFSNIIPIRTEHKTRINEYITSTLGEEALQGIQDYHYAIAYVNLTKNLRDWLLLGFKQNSIPVCTLSDYDNGNNSSDGYYLYAIFDVAKVHKSRKLEQFKFNIAQDELYARCWNIARVLCRQHIYRNRNKYREQLHLIPLELVGISTDLTEELARRYNLVTLDQLKTYGRLDKLTYPSYMDNFVEELGIKTSVAVKLLRPAYEFLKDTNLIDVIK